MAGERTSVYLTAHLAASVKASGVPPWFLPPPLVRMGAHPGQIVTQGLAWLFPGYVNDQGPDGGLLPGLAEHNRFVIVTMI